MSLVSSPGQHAVDSSLACDLAGRHTTQEADGRFHWLSASPTLTLLQMAVTSIFHNLTEKGT